MPAEWIKMQIGITKDPKVMAMTALLAGKPGFSKWAGLPPESLADRNVTRNVTVRVTVVSLLNVWGQANLSGKADGDDLVVEYSNLGTLDDWAEQPDFGEAMAYVGWAVEEESGSGGKRVRFPKFMLNNVPMEERYKKQNSDRQKRHRDKHRDGGVTRNAKSNVSRNGDSNVTGDVTGDVIVTHREEKRRIEENTPLPPLGDDGEKKPRSRKTGAGEDPRFEQFYEAFGNKKARQEALAAWGKLRPDNQLVQVILKAIARQRVAYCWDLPGGKIQPYPASWLNGRRWEDEVSIPGEVRPPTEDELKAHQAILEKQNEREREARLHAEKAERDRLARGGDIFAKPKPQPELPQPLPADEEDENYEPPF